MSIKIKEVGTPVVYTNNAGGGSDEIQVPKNGNATKQFHAGGRVTAAWYYAIHNIGDLPAITKIVCQPDGNHVNLIVGGKPDHRDARVRIAVLAAVDV